MEEKVEQQTVENNAGKIKEEDVGKVRVCPCCGKMTLQRPVAHVDDELLDHFMACMIAGVPFTHEYPLYNGKVTITARQILQADWDKIHMLEARLNRVKQPDGPESRMFAQLKKLIGLVQVKINSGKQVRVYDIEAVVAHVISILEAIESEEGQVDAVNKAYSYMVDTANVSSLPGTMLLAVNEAHAQVTDVLLEYGFDANFWKGIELN